MDTCEGLNQAITPEQEAKLRRIKEALGRKAKVTADFREILQGETKLFQELVDRLIKNAGTDDPVNEKLK